MCQSSKGVTFACFTTKIALSWTLNIDYKEVLVNIESYLPSKSLMCIVYEFLSTKIYKAFVSYMNTLDK